ncbi:hypothetical protein [Pseudarthrobacter polychromogenes]|uniref:Minor tail protein n=1 Tax=Pseudarthrobacter polychromogenes TaxID=1676 RepID=A0ABQ1XAX6_9MICC|nr:hypothetical protein [Pseudarthrobacter polychromogenes]GGG83544.1 hypothetical protein GCM10011577_01230 [Pseudarthrobacter polychromogenes]
MDGFKHTLEAIPEGSTRRTYGTAYWDGATWAVNIGGKLVGCRWLDPIQPVQGGNLLVDITNEGRGQYSAWVMGGYTDQPRPSTGTVTDFLPAGPSNRVVFTGADGISYTTDRAIGSYDLGDPVYITWDAATPTVIGKIQTVAKPPEAPPPPPPPVVASGETPLIASASDTWWGPGGWGSYATSRNGGEDVYTGTWAGNTVTGAWFYGAPRPELQGKTITRIRLRLPARISAGNYNDPAVIHIYAHTSGARPGGDVNRVAGPHDFTVPARYGGGWTDLPISFAAALVGGGGISIAGNPYAGFNSRLDDPESGKLILNWSA